MSRFLSAQKKVQSAWRKAAKESLSEAAKTGEGRYSKSGAGPYDFCLPLQNAAENLFSGSRSTALAYFASPPGPLSGGKAIHWHDGKAGNPSTHLCDSQVCCVNFLFPLRDNVEAVTRLLASAFKDCTKAVPVQNGENGLIEFEWVGDPAVELIGEGCPRTRGANATSVDAAAAFVDSAKRKHLVLIEWKYTESYAGSEKIALNKFDDGEHGKTRRKRYEALFKTAGGPVDTTRVSLEDLGYEPFYQFFRQQLLAHELNKDFASVRVLHIAPKANTDFALVTPDVLRKSHPGQTATEVWKTLVRDQSVFVSKHTEEIFQDLLASPSQGLADWARYIQGRYSFIYASEPKS